MSSKTISDQEAHEYVMKRIDSMTREEWQTWLNHVDEVFDRDEDAKNGANGRSGSHSKPAKLARVKSVPAPKKKLGKVA